jgi:hypothetical protein
MLERCSFPLESMHIRGDRQTKATRFISDDIATVHFQCMTELRVYICHLEYDKEVCGLMELIRYRVLRGNLIIVSNSLGSYKFTAIAKLMANYYVIHLG